MKNELLSKIKQGEQRNRWLDSYFLSDPKLYTITFITRMNVILHYDNYKQTHYYDELLLK